jgi:iron transport multicopper oxidase
MGQYPDGLWGPLIIHDPNPPFYYDEEFTLSLFDWYHEEMPNLIYQYQSPGGIAADGTPPPVGALINGGQNVKIHVEPNKTYLVHIICPGNYPGHAWFFDQHPMTTVEIDGVYVEPTEVNLDGQQIRIAPGQRQGVLIQTKPSTDTNYAIFQIMDLNMLFVNKGIFPPPADYNPNGTAYLIYDEDKPLPPPAVIHVLDNSIFYDDLDYTPLDHEPLLEPVTHQIILDTIASNISGISRYVGSS